jgi:hypothetical protein
MLSENASERQAGTDPRLTKIRKEGRMMKVRYLVSLGVASVVLLGAVGTAGAKDEWFVLGEQTIKATDPSVRITAEEGKWKKEDVKDVKLSVEGADVDISKVVLHWNNRPDDTTWNVGTLKAGGQTAPKSAPGHEGTLSSVTVQYKILGDAPTAKLKIWGYD